MKAWIVTAAIWMLLPLAVAAQQIPVKSVPVATGSQFVLFPSQNAAMGGVSFAVPDPLHDPIENPARGRYLNGIQFSGAPTFYHVGLRQSDDGSGGRTLPVGMMMRYGGFFGGAMMAWQELTQQRETFCCFVANDLVVGSLRPGRESLSNNNVYAFAMGGAEIPGTTLSAGVSAFVAGLNGLEGVRLLYFDGGRVEQSGHLSHIRVGLHHAAPNGAEADLVVLRHRFEMDHTMPPVWIFGEDGMPLEQVQRTEHDETHGWAAQLTYRHPLPAGWTLGARLNGDWKQHPKIPNYDLMQIPRDPGDSQAYRLGVGIARSYGQATLGLDVAYEPIDSHTWTDALEDVLVTPPDGGDPVVVVPAGEMTVENFFRFHNSLVRLGLRRAGDRVDFGMGLAVHTTRYDLDQTDFIAQNQRDQQESWSEWTGTLGVGVHFAEFQIRYLGLVTWGTGRPGTNFSGIFRGGAVDFAALESDFVVAPNGPLTLQEARVVTHQVSILVPLSN